MALAGLPEKWLKAVGLLSFTGEHAIVVTASRSTRGTADLRKSLNRNCRLFDPNGRISGLSQKPPSQGVAFTVPVSAEFAAVLTPPALWFLSQIIPKLSQRPG